MPFKSEKPSSSPLLSRTIPILAASLLMPPSSQAVVSLVSADGAKTLENTVYYAAGNITAAFIDSADTNYSFRILDLSKTQATETVGSRSHLIKIRVSSDRTAFNVATTQTLGVYLTVSGSNGSVTKAVPIATIDGADCTASNSNCLWQNAATASQTLVTNGHYFAAKFQAGQTVTLGFYPADLCADFYTLAQGSTVANGCGAAGATVTPELSPESLPVLQVSAVISAFDTVGTTGSSLDQSANPLNLKFQSDAPSLNCADRASLYQPGDGSIRVPTGGFSVGTDGGTFQSDRAPATDLIVVARDADGTPDETSAFATSGLNSIVRRVPLTETQTITGFTNSTTQDPHSYTVAFMIRDAAGLVAASPGACKLSKVQTSVIQGFLSKGNCFIATATYRSTDAWPVRLLREFRDQVLMPYSWGRYWVERYYQWSPPAAEWLMEHEAFRYPVMLALLPIEALALFILYPLPSVGFLLLLFGTAITSRRILRSGRTQIGQVVSSLLLSVLFAGVYCHAAQAEGGSSYTEQVRRTLIEQDEARARDSGIPTGSSYTERMKKKIGVQDEERARKTGVPTDYSPIEALQRSDLEKQKTQGSAATSSYTEQLQTQLGKRDDAQDSAIARVQRGETELRFKRSLDIRHAAGFRVSALLDSQISAASDFQVRSFSAVYGGSIPRSFGLFYERQFLHSELWGSLGLQGNLNLSFVEGRGAFGSALRNDATGVEFPVETDVVFKFFTLPANLALNYRLNLLHFVRPFVQAGPTLIGYVEARSDEQNFKWGYSPGLNLQGGASILLDWISRDAAWNLYDSSGIKHIYLTLEYSRLTSFGQTVSFSVSGVYAGLTFEY